MSKLPHSTMTLLLYLSISSKGGGGEGLPRKGFLFMSLLRVGLCMERGFGGLSSSYL